MAKETLEFDIKGNIKDATKDSKEFGKSIDDINSTLKEQKQILLELKKEEVKLMQARAGMNEYERSLTGIDKKIEHIKLSIKDQTLAVKGLTEEQKEATKAEKENNKESKESIANLQFMGVSLNSVKKSFSQIIPTARAMFGTIKAGIMSTGIGALIIAVTSLMAAFKRSEKGQEQFQRIMAGIGAVTNQLMDTVAELGETIIAAFTNPMKALKSFKDGVLNFFKDPLGSTIAVVSKTTAAVKTFVDETSKEVDAMVAVTTARQKAHHIQRQLQIDRAKADREINDIRLQAEDRENKSATERIELLRRAQKIEEEITNKEIKAKKILVDALKLEQEQGLNNKETKDDLARLQAELIQLDTKRLRSQRLLQTQITTAVNQEKAQKEEAKKQEDADIKEAEDKRKREGEILLALQQENTLALIEDLKTRAMEELRIQEEKELASAELMENSELVKEEIRKKFDRKRGELDKKFDKQQVKFSEMTQEQQLDIASSTAGDLAKIMGEESAAGKAFAITQATIDTFASANAAYKAMSGIPVVGPGLGAVAAGAAIAAGIANVKAIASTGDGGGGGSTPGGSGGAGSAPPAPQMMSGAFELSGVTEPEPVKAFVVTDEMTNSQNQLANIRRRATI